MTKMTKKIEIFEKFWKFFADVKRLPNLEFYNFRINVLGCFRGYAWKDNLREVQELYHH